MAPTKEIADKADEMITNKDKIVANFKTEINTLKDELNKLDEAPIELSDNVEKLVEHLGSIGALMEKTGDIESALNQLLKDAQVFAQKVNEGFGYDKKIEALEKKINEFPDDEIKKEAYEYFKKNINASLFKMLENPLKKEVEDFKKSFDSKKKEHPAEFYKVVTSLKKFENMPNINAVFLGLENLAFQNKKEELNKVLQSLDKISSIITLNLNLFINEKLNPDRIKKLFKDTTGKEVVEVFKNDKGLIEPSQFEQELNQTHQGFEKLAQTIEDYTDSKYKPVYNKLLNFYWNAMIFYETLEQELDKNDETKKLSDVIGNKGEDFAKTYEKYAKFYNPDQLNNIKKYIEEKLKYFEEIYHVNYKKILGNYKKILDTIEDENKKGIKRLILAIVNSELPNNQEEQKINEEILEFGKIVNEFNQIDVDQNDKIKKLTLEFQIPEINADISKRLGFIELIDKNSIALFDTVYDIQKKIINDLNTFIASIKEHWSKGTGALDFKSIEEIKLKYSNVISELKKFHNNYHLKIINYYDNNLKSVNKFIDNFDLMFGLKEKYGIKNIEKDVLAIPRFNFNENDLEVIRSETFKKQAINEYLAKPEVFNKLNSALQKLQELKVK
jgi:hypothetical protein